MSAEVIRGWLPADERLVHCRLTLRRNCVDEVSFEQGFLNVSSCVSLHYCSTPAHHHCLQRAIALARQHIITFPACQFRD
jgi:hypothetical protein